MLTIQVTPNWSSHMPKVSPHICFAERHHRQLAAAEAVCVSVRDVCGRAR
jgi:hypothetical protein